MPSPHRRPQEAGRAVDHAEVTRTESSPLLAVAQPWEVDRLAAHATRIAAKMATDLTLGRPERAAALVRYYDGLCRGVGLDTVLAVCQTFHETGFWSSWWFLAPRRNPAGIGVTGAVKPQPVPGGQWQQRPDGQWGKGHAFPTYASAAMSHVHGLALWAGAPAAAVATLAARCRAAGVSPYTPPAKARGSCTEWLHLGGAYNPRKVPWAHPGHATHLGKKGTPGYREIDAAEAFRLGLTYGHAMARHAQQILN